MNERERDDYRVKLSYALPIVLANEDRFSGFSNEIAIYKNRFCVVEGRIIPDDFITRLISAYVDKQQAQAEKLREESKEFTRKRKANLELMAEEEKHHGK